MEAQALILSVFGICATGFFYLLGLTLNHNKEIVSELKKINKALVGDYDQKGIVTIVHEHSEKIKEIKEKCKEVHGVMMK